MKQIANLAVFGMAVAIMVALVMYGLSMLVFGPVNAEAEQSVPPSPLKYTTYDMDGERVIKYYDTTTAHTWWVVREGNEYLVLDTAGTVSVG